MSPAGDSRISDKVNSGAARPAVFLDRDGTLIEEREYLADPEGVSLIPGAGPALRALAAAGYALVLVTNQSGIARGLFDEAAFQRVQQRLHQLLAAEGVHLDGTFFCPHHPDISGPCGCRKPGTLLFRRASAQLHLDPARSWFVGDRVRDVTPAGELGGKGVLVLTGYGDAERHELPAGVVAIPSIGELPGVIVY
jgi:D-glycero-D-manno-heptose 1,7-bisphosphate phosphatase